MARANELKKEAEESAKKFFGKPTDLVDLDNLRIFKNGYLAGAEPREKQTEELEIKLTKAKDLLLRVIELKNKPCAVGHSVNMLLYENICVEAEQFLKDCEVEK